MTREEAERGLRYFFTPVYAEELIGTLSAEPQEWISVKDGLPKKGGTYYVTIQDKNGHRYVAKDRFYYDHKYFKHVNYYKCLDSEIIAWQPINEPSPYKGE